MLDHQRPNMWSYLTSSHTVTRYVGEDCATRIGRCRLHPQLARAVVAACRLDSATIAAGVAALRTRIEGVLTA